MKKILVSLSLITLTTFTHTSVLAQVPGCITDYTCPWTPGPAPITITVYNNGVPCEAKVYYCYRICNGSYDTYIRGIEFVDSACAVGIVLDDVHLFENALSGIYTANPWGGFIHVFTAPPCSTMVAYYRQVYLASCYKLEFSGYAGSGYLIACSSVYGCVSSYKVCWDYSTSPAQLVVTYDGIISTANECEEPNANPWVFTVNPHPCAAFCPH